MSIWDVDDHPIDWESETPSMSYESMSLDGTRMLDDMRHAVGWPKFYRNNYCAEVGSPAWIRWWTLVGLGLAKPGRLINSDHDQYFVVTDAGKDLLSRLATPPTGDRR